MLTGNGSEVHEGLVIVDGAVIPAALGVNPLATITALAERSVEAVASKDGITIDYETRNGNLTYPCDISTLKVYIRASGPFRSTIPISARSR